MTSRLRPKLEQDYSDLPPPAHIAFAFAVIRSKLPHVSIEEHLEGLRGAIVSRPGQNSSNIFGFDAEMYWKASYQKAEFERLRLLNELAQLKQERDSLRSHRDPDRSRGPGALEKRRRDTSAQPGNKKRKNLADVDLDGEEVDLDLGNVNAPTTNHQAFLRGFISLRRSVVLAEPDQDVLVSAIRAVNVSISQILLNDMQATRRLPTEQEFQSVKEVCTSFKRAYRTILRGLDTVEPQSGDGGDQYVPALSDVVKVFQTFLGRLHKFALDEFARREQQITSKRRGSGFRSEETQEKFSQGYSPTSDKDLETAKELIRVLVGMITTLDVSKESHCELLEGCMCALLDHIGSTLSLLVFVDSEMSQKKQDGLIPPSGLLDMAQLNIDSATGAAIIGGPYVVFILRKTVDFLLANAKTMPQKSLLNFTLRPSDGSNQMNTSDLRRRIGETLQNTLLRGAFDDDDDTFYNSLRRYEEEGEDTDLEKMVEDIKQKEDSAEWFIGELWEHLGWDILSGRRGS